VDDDPQVLKVLKRDLTKRYGNRFRVLQARSGQKAFEITKKLKLSDGIVALFLADQRMPQMTGVEFLGKTMDIFPDAKRVLLTDYGDTEAVMKSINKVSVDYYLIKPWHPPEVHLYPHLNDLLDDWWISFRPPFEGIKVIGLRWSPRSHETKEFLARNGISYQWLDIEDSKEARRLVSSAMINTKSRSHVTGEKHFNTEISSARIDDTSNKNNSKTASSAAMSMSEPYLDASLLHLPLVVFPDGTYMAEPTNLQLAEKIGLKTRAQMAFYDLIVIGGGPSGLAAAVYSSSEGLHTLLVERHAPGGQAGASSNIENYLGFPSGLSGPSLARRAVAQAVKFGTEILEPQEVVELRTDGQYRIAKLGDGTEIRCHTMIIACGVTYRMLDDVKGIDKFTGAGVYYGASMVEALNYKGQDIYIVGGANSAGQAAVFFARYAKQVTLIVRSDTLERKMSHYLIHQINETKNIRVWLNSVVTEVKGEYKLERLILTNTKTGKQHDVPASGLFIYIGAEPHTDWLYDWIKRDAHGFILTGSDLRQDELENQGWMLDRQPFLLETSIPGVFAVGDVRHGSIKRIAAGVGEGSTAIQLIHQYMMNT
jgi:thioredoxin reductase (NADPH)